MLLLDTKLVVFNVLLRDFMQYFIRDSMQCTCLRTV